MHRHSFMSVCRVFSKERCICRKSWIRPEEALLWHGWPTLTTNERRKNLQRCTLIEIKSSNIYKFRKKTKTDMQNTKRMWCTLMINSRSRSLFSLHDLIKEFATMWDGHIGWVVVSRQRNDLSEPGRTPIHQNPYCVGRQHCKFEKTETSKMLAEKVMDPANMEWFSRILLLPEKNGYVCSFGDHRKLNAVTIRKRYLIPRVDKAIDSLGYTKIILNLEAKAVCWLIEMNQDAKENTTQLQSPTTCLGTCKCTLDWKMPPQRFHMQWTLFPPQWRASTL